MVVSNTLLMVCWANILDSKELMIAMSKNMEETLNGFILMFLQKKIMLFLYLVMPKC